MRLTRTTARLVALTLISLAPLTPAAEHDLAGARDSDTGGDVRGTTIDVSARIFGGRYSGGGGGNSMCEYSNDPERIRGLLPEAFIDGPPLGDQLARTVNGIQEIRYVRLCQSPPTFDDIWVPSLRRRSSPYLYDAMQAELSLLRCSSWGWILSSAGRMSRCRSGSGWGIRARFR